MKAFIARSYGGVDALEFVDVELREPGDGEVTIAVRAAGVNPSDAKSLSGEFGRDEAALPLHPGAEISGVITAVGPDVSLSVGDEVIAYRVSGGFAEYVTVRATSVYPKPATLSFAEAAGLLLAAGTAYHLVEATRVGEGDRVIVHGASGSVGLAAVQLVRSRGASVIGTTSERNFDVVSRFGATPVAYGPGLVERLRALSPEGADVALDTVGTLEALDASVELVADRSRVATVVNFSRAGELGVLALGGGPGADPGTKLRNEARGLLIDAAAAGLLQVVVGRTFPLTETPAAVRLASSGHPGGKVVVVT